MFTYKLSCSRYVPIYPAGIVMFGQQVGQGAELFPNSGSGEIIHFQIQPTGVRGKIPDGDVFYITVLKFVEEAIMAKEIMNINEVSEYAKIDESEIWHLANKDQMPVVKDRWHWKFKKTAIDEWLKKRSQNPKK